jgi:DMSO/TMAO reductase YedYZ molybdopterin-dependent catalytic subunit
MYEPGLIPLSFLPENKEFPMSVLATRITPNSLFFLRTHAPYPEHIHLQRWRLTVKGCVRRTIRLKYEDLCALPHSTLPVTLECAGNKRVFFEPKTQGIQWGIGGISHATWTGVPLRLVLEMAGILPHASEVLFEGMDIGPRTDLPGSFSYCRSLPLEKAFHPDTMLAMYMNAEVLPFKHGFPVRLIVPGWYGMASVKWLRRIIVLDHSFQGPFQSRDYVLLEQPNDYSNAVPVTRMQVNSVIARPIDRDVLRRGQHEIYGVAWTGTTPLKVVEVSTDGGETWYQADWVDEEEQYSWRRWRLNWNVLIPGEYTIMARATDGLGNSQPSKTAWNVKGYMNNSIHTVHVYVE